VQVTRDTYRTAIAHQSLRIAMAVERRHTIMHKLLLLAASAATLTTSLAHGDAPPVMSRGQYLVELAGCGHCHTPGHFLGKEDTTRELAGSDVGFEVPGAGTFVGPNLTPDKASGLGSWSDTQIATAIRNGVRPDGRVLSPVMPWPNFTHMSDADVHAIIAYLRRLKPIANRVPGPYPEGVEPRVFAWRMFMPPTATR
jgi:mono/diheme cytochrome c family protein